MECDSSSGLLDHVTTTSVQFTAAKDSNSQAETLLDGAVMTRPALPETVVPKPVAGVLSAQSVVPSDAQKLSLLRDLKTPFLDPFGGFGGHVFMHFCQLVEFCCGWKRPRIQSQDAAAEALLPSCRLRQWGTCSLGTIACTIVAAGLIPIFNSSSLKSFLPLIFLLIIGLVAFRFGRAAGVLGTLASAFLFADYLFEPEGLAVADPVAREHLIWMMIIGIVISELAARFQAHRLRAHKLRG